LVLLLIHVVEFGEMGDLGVYLVDEVAELDAGLP
jgi:hypothetical protein